MPPSGRPVRGEREEDAVVDRAKWTAILMAGTAVFLVVPFVDGPASHDGGVAIAKPVAAFVDLPRRLASLTPAAHSIGGYRPDFPSHPTVAAYDDFPPMGFDPEAAAKEGADSSGGAVPAETGPVRAEPGAGRPAPETGTAPPASSGNWPGPIGTLPHEPADPATQPPPQWTPPSGYTVRPPSPPQAPAASTTPAAPPSYAAPSRAAPKQPPRTATAPPAAPRPAYQPPAYGAPPYAAPGYPVPMYGHPAYAPPGYGPRGYAGPAPADPAYPYGVAAGYPYGAAPPSGYGTPYPYGAAGHPYGAAPHPYGAPMAPSYAPPRQPNMAAASPYSTQPPASAGWSAYPTTAAQPGADPRARPRSMHLDPHGMVGMTGDTASWGPAGSYGDFPPQQGGPTASTGVTSRPSAGWTDAPRTLQDLPSDGPAPMAGPPGSYPPLGGFAWERKTSATDDATPARNPYAAPGARQ